MHPSAEPRIPEFPDVEAAAERIRFAVRQTPVVHSATLDQALGCTLVAKCENLQVTGSFKFRGATHAVARLRSAGRDADVATHSSGNHGAALALAARNDGRQAFVVMPDNAVPDKVDAVRRHGGQVIFCAPGQAAREAGLEALVADGRIPVPPYDHPDIICGQGTAALELLTQTPDLDILMAPVGGGGLISGSAIVARHLRPDLTILAAEPAGAADTAASFQRGERVTHWQADTIADGLRALVGALPFRIIRQRLDDVLPVSEAAILEGMDLVQAHLQMTIEPSSATVIAAILEHAERFAGRRVGVIFSGGNVDTRRFPPESV